MNIRAATATAFAADEIMPATGPSFAAALCGFVSTTVAATMVLILLSSV